MADFGTSCSDNVRKTVDVEVIEKCLIVDDAFNQRMRQLFSNHAAIFDEVLYGINSR